MNIRALMVVIICSFVVTESFAGGDSSKSKGALKAKKGGEQKKKDYVRGAAGRTRRKMTYGGILNLDEETKVDLPPKYEEREDDNLQIKETRTWRYSVNDKPCLFRLAVGPILEKQFTKNGDWKVAALACQISEKFEPNSVASEPIMTAMGEGCIASHKKRLLGEQGASLLPHAGLAMVHAGKLAENHIFENVVFMVKASSFCETHTDEARLEILKQAHLQALRLAVINEAQYLVFPIMRCGDDVRKSALNSIQGCIDYLDMRKTSKLKEIHFVVDNVEEFDVYVEILQKLF